MAGSPGPTVRVWDVPVRLLHWTLVVAVVLAVLSTWALLPEIGISIGGWHQPAGYVTLVVVLLRTVWGFTGGRDSSHRHHSHCSRFSQFMRSPRETWRYLQQVRRHAEPRHIGHNPLGGWMVLLLLGCIAGLGLTGWLYTSDRYWGSETVEDIHVALSWLLLALVGLHVAGVAFTSLRQRENLVLAMFTGRKAAPRQGDPPA
ncbi:MAG: cytochrome b/b6 domain-containing protein [Rubrivivax sp.]